MSANLLLATSSPDGKLMAVHMPAATQQQLRISLLQVPSGDLQTTLTYQKSKDGGVAATASKILFLDDTHVAVVLDAGCMVVWDLVRGVVAYTYPAASGDEKSVLVDVAVDTTATATSGPSSGPSFFALMAKEEKLQIHEVQTQTAKLVKKVKAGKGRLSSLVVSGNCLVVVHPDSSLRVLDSVSGSKVCKGGALGKVGASAEKPLLVVVNGKFVCTTVDGQVVLVEIKTGKVQQKWPLPTAATSLQSSNDSSSKGGATSVLINQTHLYQFEDMSKEPVLKHVLHVDPTVERSSLVLIRTDLYAVLRRDRFQLQTVKLTQERVTISFQDDESSTKAMDLQQEEGGGVKGKRPQRALVLGPGQAGGEARQVSEGPSSKKPRLIDNDDEEDALAQGEDVTGPTIAQRLEELQKALDEDDAMDDDEDDNNNNKEGDQGEGNDGPLFHPRKATTESLTQILQQALQSRDDALLELALSVKDAKIVEKTCQSLGDEFLTILLTALTNRLASKPSRAEHLCQTWLMTLLRTGRVRSVQHLQPLRNLLQDRVEIFPALLQLEGKLSMLGSL